MEFGQTPKQLFTRPHPSRLPPSDVATAPRELPLANADSVTECTADVISDVNLTNVTQTYDTSVCRGKRDDGMTDTVMTSPWFENNDSLLHASVTHQQNLHKAPATRVLFNESSDVTYSIAAGACRVSNERMVTIAIGSSLFQTDS